jgi:hypothetical protein
LRISINQYKIDKMNGVVEWEKSGKPTGKFSPYIKIGRGKVQMVVYDGKPEEYNTWKEAKQAAKDMETFAKQKPQL